jgi:hypothetical protein
MWLTFQIAALPSALEMVGRVEVRLVSEVSAVNE